MAAFVAILIAFATGAMGWRDLIDCLLETVYTTAAIFFIVVGAFIFSRFIVLTQFPNELTAWVQAVGLSPFWILMAVMALYVLLGTFLDEVSTILITVPVTLPLINSIGYDGIWFGIFVTVMCTIGLISPPTGMTVFVIQAQHPEIPVMRIYLGTLPFLAADFVLVALLIFMPSLALWLPRVLFGSQQLRELRKAFFGMPSDNQCLFFLLHAGRSRHLLPDRNLRLDLQTHHFGRAHRIVEAHLDEPAPVIVALRHLDQLGRQPTENRLWDWRRPKQPVPDADGRLRVSVLLQLAPSSGKAAMRFSALITTSGFIRPAFICAPPLVSVA